MIDLNKIREDLIKLISEANANWDELFRASTKKEELEGLGKKLNEQIDKIINLLPPFIDSFAARLATRSASGKELIPDLKNIQSLQKESFATRIPTLALRNTITRLENLRKKVNKRAGLEEKPNTSKKPSM